MGSTPERERQERVTGSDGTMSPKMGPRPEYRQKSRDKFSGTGTEDLKRERSRGKQFPQGDKSPRDGSSEPENHPEPVD